MFTEPTFKDLVDFVLVNKGDKTFRGYSEGEIVCMLKRGIEEHSLYYEQGLDGRVIGMILAEVDHERKTIWVTENLAMSLTVLNKFAQKGKMQFPNYNLSAQRHGHDVHFNTEKLYTKLN